MYWNTKEYIKESADHMFKPMLKRAASVKNLTSNIVLENKVTDYTAQRLDGAMNVFEKYVDRYLPQSVNQKGDDQVDAGKLFLVKLLD
jgi:perilipin-2